MSLELNSEVKDLEQLTHWQLGNMGISGFYQTHLVKEGPAMAAECVQCNLYLNKLRR